MVGGALNNYYMIYKEQQKQGTRMAREWVKGVKVGDQDLEELLFPDEVEMERVAKAKEAAEKIKAAVAQMNKMMAEEGFPKNDKPSQDSDELNQAEEVAKLFKAEIDAKAAEAEAKQKAEAEALKKAEEEAKKKAEEEAKRLAEEQEAKRLAEE